MRNPDEEIMIETDAVGGFKSGKDWKVRLTMLQRLSKAEKWNSSRELSWGKAKNGL